MPKTISFHNGSDWSRGHNVRDKRFIKEQAHIDTQLSENNVILVDEPVRIAYDRIFGKAVSEFNAKQKRSDRRIENYYCKIKQDKRKHIVYECIVQIGDKDDTGNNAPLEKEALKRFVKEWEKRNPNLKLIGAYIHCDEPGGTVHLHIDYIPAAECTRGMKLQNSLDKALQQQGFRTENIHKTAQIAWQDSERKALISICNELGIDVCRDTQGITKGRKHLSKSEYQQLKDTAKRQMEHELLPYQTAVDDVLRSEPQNAAEGVPLPSVIRKFLGKENRDKLLYSPSEIEKVRQLAKAAAVISSKNEQDKVELHDRYAELSKLEAKAEKTLTYAERQRKQAEQVKKEADEYAAQKQEFYADSLPYIRQLQEQITHLQDNIKWLSQDRKEQKEHINEQTKEIDSLKKRIGDLQAIKHQNGELLEHIKVLEDELKEKERILYQKDVQNKELSDKYAKLSSLWYITNEIGEYIADRIGLDFDEILDMRQDGYKLSYIIDEGHNKGAR